MDEWREGPARLFDPADECPGCHAKGACWASDFKKFGKQKIRSCSACNKTFNGDEEIGHLIVHERKV